MRKFLAACLMAIPLALFALVLGLELSQNKVLLHTTAGQFGRIDLDRHDYLSVTDGSIALDGPWLPQRVANTDYVPIFAVSADGTQAQSPSLIAMIPAGALADLLQPPDSVGVPRRIDLLGMRSTRCADRAKATLPAGGAPLTCLAHGKHPRALTRVLIGSAILLLPIVGLGLWLWRRQGSAQTPHPPPGCLIKMAKVAMVVLIFSAVAIGKMSDELWPAAIKTAAPGIHTAPVATRLSDSLAAYARSGAAAADAVNYGYKLASLQKNLDALEIAPGDTVEVHLIQLDALSTYRRDAQGAFRRQQAKALFDYQIHLNGNIAGGQYVAVDTADHWPGVALRQRGVQEPVELVAEQTVHTATRPRPVRIVGQIEFLEGDAAHYQRGDTVVFRYTAAALRQVVAEREKLFQRAGGNPRLSASLSNLHFEASGDTLRARSTGPNRHIFRP